MEREGSAERVYRTVMPGEVRDYLLAHPDFLSDNDDILTALVPPAKDRGPKVEDFQRHMLARLQEHITAIRGEHDDLMEMMQDHLQRQNRVNAVVLSLLDASSFAEVLAVATRDLALIMDQEAACLFLESGGVLEEGEYGGLTVVPEGFVTRALGSRTVALEECAVGDAALFGAKAAAIRSQALLRLTLHDNLPPALLALGHRDPMYYATGLATEQVELLGAVIERCVGRERQAVLSAEKSVTTGGTIVCPEETA